MITLRRVEVLGSPGVADIVIDNGKIREVVSSAPAGESSSLIFEDAIAFPGLINSHDHLEFNCYPRLGDGPYRDYVEWGAAIHHSHAAEIAAVEAAPRRLRIRAGIAKNLLCGVTSIAHHGPDPDCAGAPLDIIGGTVAIHSPRLGSLRPLLMPGRSLVVAHVGEGVGRDAEREIDAFLRWNLWGKKVIGVHAIAMRSDQAARFAAVVWCPASNEFLFGRTAPIAQLKNHAPILFGTDSTLTAPWNIWEHLRRARSLGALTDDELIAALTTNAARAWKLSNRGRLAAGAAADIVIARKRHDDQRDAFFAIDPEDILVVMKDGAIVLADASIGPQLDAGARLFRARVNGVEKLTVDNYSELASSLLSVSPSISIAYLQRVKETFE